MTEMEYYIYVNWTHDYAGVHRADCGVCNFGKGTHTNKTVSNGIWIGPLSNKEEADFVASKLRRKTITKCSRCS